MTLPPPNMRRAIVVASRASSTERATCSISAWRPIPPTTLASIPAREMPRGISVAAVRAFDASTSSGAGTRKKKPPPRSMTTTSPLRVPEHVQTDAPDLGVLLRRDALVEPLAFDRDRDVAGGQRDPARVRVLAGLERIVVGAREQAIPERAPPPAAAAGVAREFDRDLGGRQAHQRAPLGDAAARENRQPAQPRAAGSDREGPAARVGRRLQRHAVLAVAVERRPAAGCGPRAGRRGPCRRRAPDASTRNPRPGPPHRSPSRDATPGPGRRRRSQRCEPTLRRKLNKASTPSRRTRRA